MGKRVMNKSVCFTLKDLDLVEYIQNCQIDFSTLVKISLRYYRDRNENENKIRTETINLINKLNSVSNTSINNEKQVKNKQNNINMNIISNIAKSAKKHV